jgi:hypothetical protein
MWRGNVWLWGSSSPSVWPVAAQFLLGGRNCVWLDQVFFGQFLAAGQLLEVTGVSAGDPQFNRRTNQNRIHRSLWQLYRHQKGAGRTGKVERELGVTTTGLDRWAINGPIPQQAPL